MGEATIFSTVDFRSGSWQLTLNVKDKEMTQDQEWGCSNVHECFWPDRCSQLLTSYVHGHMCSYDKRISISTAAIEWPAKLPTTILTSMINKPFGRQWKLIAINVLVVSRSLNNNIHLLVMQGYHKIGSCSSTS